MLKLAKFETIVTAFAESASGSGWANTPIWVIVKDGDGNLRRECIQPEDQTLEMHQLYHICQAAHFAMTAAVAKGVQKKKKIA